MTDRAKDRQIAGGLMIAASALVVLTMAHHPTSVGRGPLVEIVHSVMIALELVLGLGFLVFVLARGSDRLLMLSGAVAYLFSMIASIGAATVNGFVSPALLGSGAPVNPDVVRFGWHYGQALASIGAYTTSAAYLLWALDLLHGPQRLARLAGLAGIIAGGLPLVLLMTGALRMNVAGAMLIYGLDVAWAVLVGLLLIRDGVSRGPDASGQEQRANRADS